MRHPEFILLAMVYAPLLALFAWEFGLRSFARRAQWRRRMRQDVSLSYPDWLADNATWRDRLGCLRRGHSPAEMPRNPEDLDSWETFCLVCGGRTRFDRDELDAIANNRLEAEKLLERQIAETKARREWSCRRCGVSGAGFLPDEHLHIDPVLQARFHERASERGRGRDGYAEEFRAALSPDARDLHDELMERLNSRNGRSDFAGLDQRCVTCWERVEADEAKAAHRCSQKETPDAH